MKIDLEIKELIIEEDRSEHIAKHGVKIEEVLEIISGDFVFIQGKYERWQLLGKSKKGRFFNCHYWTKDKKEYVWVSYSSFGK